MKITDILKIENNNKTSIFLLKEGIFWRCYEYSAWRFIMNIKNYQVLKKYVKTVKQDIVYIGFPDSILEQILKTVETRRASSHKIHKKEAIIEIKGFAFAEGFEQWKEGIKLKEKTMQKNNVETHFVETQNFASLHYHIIEKIRNYPSANKTPIETFNFFVQIQKEINGKI